MEETNIRFEDLPEAVQWIKNKLTEIALKIDRMHGNVDRKRRAAAMVLNSRIV